MRRVCVVAVLLAGCGRIGFDPFGAGGDGGTTGGEPGPPGDTTSTGDTGPDSALPSGVFAHYPLDDLILGSPIAADTSGNMRDAVCPTLAQCPVQVAGRPGGLAFAAQFNGTTSNMRWMPAGTEADLPQFTIMAWIKPDAMPGDFETIIARPFGATMANSFALQHNAGARLIYFSEAGNSLFSNTAVPVGAWSHVAISYDGTFKRVYRNGNLEGSGNQGAGVTYDSHPIVIGADVNGGVTDHNFQGAISDVLIFSRALSDTEVRSFSM